MKVNESLYNLLPVNQFIPAVCQGVIGLQTRKDWQYNYIVEKTSDRHTSITTSCERKFLQLFNADCKTPIAGYAEIQGNDLYFTGMFTDRSGKAVIRSSFAAIEKSEELAINVAEQINKCIL